MTRHPLDNLARGFALLACAIYGRSIGLPIHDVASALMHFMAATQKPMTSEEFAKAFRDFEQTLPGLDPTDAN